MTIYLSSSQDMPCDGEEPPHITGSGFSRPGALQSQMLLSRISDVVPVMLVLYFIASCLQSYKEHLVSLHVEYVQQHIEKQPVSGDKSLFAS